MTTTATKPHCKQCGAPVKKREMTVCWSCGTPYSFLEEQERLPRAERFEAADALPALEGLLAKKPPRLHAFAVLSRPILIGVLLLFGARFTRLFLVGDGTGAIVVFLVTAIAVIVALVALGMIIVGGARVGAFLRAPLVRRPAVVIGKATLKPGGNLLEAQGKPLRFHLEFRTENKDRVRASAAVSKDLSIDDLGVAYIQGPFLLEFTKLDL